MRQQTPRTTTNTTDDNKHHGQQTPRTTTTTGDTARITTLLAEGANPNVGMVVGTYGSIAIGSPLYTAVVRRRSTAERSIGGRSTEWWVGGGWYRGSQSFFI